MFEVLGHSGGLVTRPLTSPWLSYLSSKLVKPFFSDLFVLFVSVLYYFRGIRKYSESLSVSWISQVALKHPLCIVHMKLLVIIVLFLHCLHLGAQCW